MFDLILQQRLLIEDFISFYFIDISSCISLFDKKLGAFAYGNLVLNEYFGWMQTLYLLLYLIFYEMVEVLYPPYVLPIFQQLWFEPQQYLYHHL